MKKVLFILGDFWPTHSGGTIRIAKLIKYLPEYNWEGVVLSRKLDDMKDFEIINGTTIYRTNAFDLPKYYQKLKKNRKTTVKKITVEVGQTIESTNNRLADNFFVPDVNIFWAIGAFFRLRKIIKKENINVLYSSSPLASSHIVVLLYRKFFSKSVKWIVEFRDPWTFNPFISKKPYLLNKLDHFLEKMVIKSSDSIIVTSEEYKEEFLKKYSFLDTNKIRYIPNGFDAEDFEGLHKSSNNEKITIVHTGNFYGKRSLKPFLEALTIIKEEYPQYKKSLKFVQYGTIDPEGALYNLNFPNSFVEIIDNIPHRESLQQTINADWLLLVPGPGNGTMPGKLYEYLATGNPIIALADEGPAKKIINDLNIGYVTNTFDITKIKNILVEIILAKSNFKTESLINAKISKFERKNIANQVSEVLNSNLS
ncbi:glycosyltransferase [Flavobacterium sp. YO64]|uniref:glycosyltransferase n=1 Tax=Flavobacterium sp. YO64 TaxID=394559 RepID=UPI00100A4907|nr:glycosyltransferase [Flavobacterium sp. YO64]RXM43993.1 hypothetical protein BOW57_10500 [Flavobacterium sp. YO64]